LKSETELISPPILEARNLTVVYGGQKVLDIPAVRVVPGKVLAIIGPNGSGKTTLLTTLALLQKPTTGSIFSQGHEVREGSGALQLRRRFAVVFQQPLLLDNTVWDNVTLGLHLRKVSHPEIKERAERWLHRFGISGLARRQTRSLSGGEAQRTSLARAFALQPDVLFLDEPFAALDTPTRQALFGDMVNILQETHVTTVLVTHDRNEAQSLAHRIVILMKGSIVQEGTPEDIFASPATEEIAEFVGMENIIEGFITSCTDNLAAIDVKGQTIEGVCRYEIGKPVYVCIRPEDITIALARTSTSARNVLTAKIVSLIPSGSLVRVKLDCGFPLVSLITRMSTRELELEVGKTVYASFKATAIHVIIKK
jgi:tungstate transport system ATP-binding protein